MSETVAENSQQRYLPSQNPTTYPAFPNPTPNSYVIAILKYCDKDVLVCYGCLGRFRENGYPVQSNDVIVVSKTQRHYTDPKTQQKALAIDFSNTYNHFHQACLSLHNALFTPQLIYIICNIF